MPMFYPKAMTFAQYIEDIYEIKAWGFDWNTEKKLRNLALILPTGWCTKVFRDIQADNKKAYEVLKGCLIREIDRTDEKRQSAASEFHKLTQKQNETIDEFGHRLFRKCEEAYPGFAKANCAELCAQRFIEGIKNPKVKEQLQVAICHESKMPKFDNLVDIARRLTDTDSSRAAAPQAESVFRIRCNYCHKLGHN